MGVLAEAGRLHETGIARLLLDLLRARFTGRLELRQGRVRKRILLREGLPQLAESSRRSESLGALLRSSGRISASDEEALEARVQSQRCRELEAALALRLVPPRELLDAVGDHARRCLLDVFGWGEGEFELEAAEQSADAPAGLGVDPLPLVQQGIESRWSPERVLGELGEKAARFARRTERAQALAGRLQGGPELERLLADLDGGRTLAQCLQRAGSAGALAAAWVLDAADALEYAETAVSEAEPGAAPAFDIELVSAKPGAAAKSARTPEAPSSRPASRADPEAEVLREEVKQKSACLAELDHYELLGIAPTADAAQIKRAYLQAAKRFHPDALTRMGLDDVKQQANEVFAQITRAHTELSDPVKRREYDASRESDADALSEADANRVAQAEMLFRKAAVVLRAGRFSDALQLLRSCVALWPEEAAYQCDLAWALYRQPRPEFDAARQALEKAIALEPENALAHYRLSLVLASLGDQLGASRARARATRLDPDVARR